MTDDALAAFIMFRARIAEADTPGGEHPYLFDTLSLVDAKRVSEAIDQVVEALTTLDTECARLLAQVEQLAAVKPFAHSVALKVATGMASALEGRKRQLAAALDGRLADPRAGDALDASGWPELLERVQAQTQASRALGTPEAEPVDLIRRAMQGMVADGRALVQWYAEHFTPGLAPATVTAIVAAVGEISIDEAVAALGARLAGSAL